jgi:hypothetical protein
MQTAGCILWRPDVAVQSLRLLGCINNEQSWKNMAGLVQISVQRELFHKFEFKELAYGFAVAKARIVRKKYCIICDVIVHGQGWPPFSAYCTDCLYTLES